MTPTTLLQEKEVSEKQTTHATDRVRFVADGMLGSLTRWLRILGFDVVYSGIQDSDLLEIAYREHRILLTGDVDLCRRALRRGVQAVLVRGNAEEDRLRDLNRSIGISLDATPELSRCAACNSPLEHIQTSHLDGRVHKGTLKHHSRFWVCRSCGKVYWHGGHWKNIERVLTKAKSVEEA